MAEKEYIEREALVERLKKEECDCEWLWTILDIPAADVVPVKHGHFRRLTFSGDTIICSECKMAYNIFETNGAENFNFCPHCGAKIMDGGDNE